MRGKIDVRRLVLLSCLMSLIGMSASPWAVPAAAQGTPTITYRVLGQGSAAVFLYRFRFQPAASIPGPYPETMMFSVQNGTFLLYLGAGARARLDPPGAGAVTTLEPLGSSGGETTFDDIPANQGPTFSCTPNCLIQTGPGGLEVAGGIVLGNVAVKLTAGMTVMLAGPNNGFVCNTGDNPGRIEIAVAGLAGADLFSWLAYATEQSSTSIDNGLASGDAPANLSMALLPARNPGGCAGKTG